MDCGLFILFAGGAHYAFPNAFIFLLAVLAGAAASRKNGRLLLGVASGLAIGVASWILILHDFRPGGASNEAELFVQCVIGAGGGFFGVAVVKTRKKRKKATQAAKSLRKNLLRRRKKRIVKHCKLRSIGGNSL